MSNQAEAMMQDQIEGAISENEALRQEVDRLRTEVARLKEHAVTLAETARLVERERWEPAGAKCRFINDSEWSACTLDHARMVQQRPDEWPGYEVRILYAERGA